MSPPRRPSRVAAALTWLIGGVIAVACAYVAYRSHSNERIFWLVRWGMTIMAAIMLVVFAYSFFDPKVWAKLFGASLPSQNRASIVGHVVALMLLAVLALASVWLLRDWIWT